MEDMCQLTLHPTEYKYKSSYEQIARTIMKYSSTPKLDLTNYMQLLLYCFVTGNNDIAPKELLPLPSREGLSVGSSIRPSQYYDSKS